MQDVLDINEFSQLTQDALVEILAPHDGPGSQYTNPGRRSLSRWPFPATVELWVPVRRGRDEYVLATCMNLSTRGIGIRTNEELQPDTELAIAVHQPEKTLYGRATVRHCTETTDGFYVGLEFLFDPVKQPDARRSR